MRRLQDSLVLAAVVLAATGAVRASDRVSIDLVGHTEGGVGAVAVAGTRAYVATGAALSVLDVSDPSAPVLVARSDLLDSDIEHVELMGDYAVVATWLGVYVMQVAGVERPTVVGVHDAVEKVTDLVVVGNAAFVATMDDGFVILDVSDPAAPQYVGAYATDGELRHAAIEGDRAYLLTRGRACGSDPDCVPGFDGLLVLDISDPAAPELIGSLESGSEELPYSGNSVVAEGSFVFAGGSNGFIVYDASDPASIQVVGRYEHDPMPPSLPISRIMMFGQRVYAALGCGNLLVVDVSDRTNPVLMGLHVTKWTVNDMDVAGDMAYLATYGEGLPIVDFSTPETPVEVGRFDSLADARGLARFGDNVVAASGWPQMVVFDASDDAALRRIGSIDLGDNTFAVDVDGHYAFVVGGSEEYWLRVVDLSLPAQPQLVGSCSLGSTLYFAVAVTNGYAYVGGRGIVIVDVSEPTQPYIVGASDKGGSDGIAVRGDYVYTTSGGMAIHDVSDPTNPVFLGDWGPSAQDVALRGDIAYVPSGRDDIFLYDVSDPTSPVELGTFGDAEWAHRLAVAGNVLWVGDGYGEVFAYDVTTPSEPKWIATYESNYSLDALLAWGSRAFVSGYGAGLVALELRWRADADGDWDVDLTDYGAFVGCYNGMNRPPGQSDCGAADLDGDGDVDWLDYATFLDCYSGPGNLPACR
jgi:hypothetical protein